MPQLTANQRYAIVAAAIVAALIGLGWWLSSRKPPSSVTARPAQTAGRVNGATTSDGNSATGQIPIDEQGKGPDF